MKNKRALLMMAVAILFGIAAVLLASRWLLSKTPGTNRVVVAVNDVSRGQRLLPEMLKLVEWQGTAAPADAFTDFSKLTDRVLKVNVMRGELLSESKLAPAGTLGGLSAMITEGKRAITVRVNDVIGVAGFALPGNYVDVIVHTERDPAENDRTPRSALHISKIVLERILVLAVAQEVGRDDTKPRVVNAVTLEVTPQQAEALDLARGVGTLSLALRNQVDPQLPDTPGATKRSVLDEPEPPVKVAASFKVARALPRVQPVQAVAQVKRACVSVINGLYTSQECF